MIRLRVSSLDQWVKYIEPEREEFELSDAEFRARLLGQQTTTPEMLAGTALHAFLERAQAGDDVPVADSQGFRFFFAEDLQPLALRPVREGEVQKLYQTPSGPVLLSGHPDALGGISIDDYKLTFSPFDAERYSGSLQWRAYLDMTGSKRFRYVVFEGKLDERTVVVRASHELTFWAYPEMAADVRARVEELAAYVVAHVPELVR